MAKMKAVYIEWQDSVYRPGWTSTDDLEPCHVQTLGWLIGEDSESVTIAAHINELDDDCNCPLVIPRAAITRRVNVKAAW